MFTQRRKTGDNEGETKDYKNKTQINLDHITCNYCGENVMMRETVNALQRQTTRGSRIIQKNEAKEI